MDAKTLLADLADMSALCKLKGLGNRYPEMLMTRLKGGQKAKPLLPGRLSPPTEKKGAVDVLQPLEDKDSPMSRLLKEALARDPKLRRILGERMERGKSAFEKLFATRTAARSIERQLFLKKMDFQNRLARSTLDDAINSLPDADLRDLLRQAAKRDMPGSLEKFADDLARQLTKDQSKVFLQALHQRLCRQMMELLGEAMADPLLNKRIVEIYDGVLKSGQDRLAAEFRRELKLLLTEDEPSEVLARVIRQMEGKVRDDFVRGMFALLLDPGRSPLLADFFRQNFSPIGLRKLLTSYASFRKVYNIKRMKKAMENLIGWMYEASEQITRLVRSANRHFRDQLADAVPDAGLDIKVGAPVEHFDVLAPSLSRKTMRQATDALGTVPLTSFIPGARITRAHVFGVVLESKGEKGVKEGITQAGKNLRRRFRNGDEVVTENGRFIVGETLFLSLEDALKALGSKPDAVARVGAAMRGKGRRTFRAIVVSPLDKVAAERRYGALFKSAGVEYEQHMVPREQMERAAAAVAPHMGLVPFLK